MVSVIISFVPCVLYFCVHIPLIIGLLIVQMTTWSFREAFAELEVRGHLDKSMLQSMQGLHMGDICIAEIQTTYLDVRSVLLHVSAIHQKGEFQPRQSACRQLQSYHSYTPCLHPDPCLTDIEHVGIGNVIPRHGSPLGGIDSVNTVITHIHAWS